MYFWYRIAGYAYPGDAKFYIDLEFIGMERELTPREIDAYRATYLFEGTQGDLRAVFIRG